MRMKAYPRFPPVLSRGPWVLPGLDSADSSAQVPADLLDHLQKQGWAEVSPGVMQHSLGGNRVETLGFGAAGLRFELQAMKAHLADLREDYARQPSRQLRITLRSPPGADPAHRGGLEKGLDDGRRIGSVSAEGLLAPGSNPCSATYDAAAIAYPLAQGTAAKSAAHWNSACSEIGEVYAHSKSKCHGRGRLRPTLHQDRSRPREHDTERQQRQRRRQHQRQPA